MVQSENSPFFGSVVVSTQITDSYLYYQMLTAGEIKRTGQLRDLGVDLVTYILYILSNRDVEVNMTARLFMAPNFDTIQRKSLKQSKTILNIQIKFPNQD